MFKSGSELGRIGLRGGRLHGNHVISGTKPAAPETKCFTCLAPKPIAITGAAHGTARDRQSQPRDRSGVRWRSSVMKAKKPVGDAGARGKHAPELVTAKQSGAAREAMRRSPWFARGIGHRNAAARSAPTRRSGRQALATAGAPRVDDGAAGTGGHAGAKAVTAGALEATGLESAFHDSRPRDAMFKRRLEPSV